MSTTSTQSNSYSKQNVSKRESRSIGGKLTSHAENSRLSTLSKKRKDEPSSTQYPEIAAPDYYSEEPEHPVSPIVRELTRIKERVTEVYKLTHAIIIILTSKKNIMSLHSSLQPLLLRGYYACTDN